MYDPIRAWLQRSTQTSIQVSLVWAGATIAFGVALLCLTFIIVYALSGLIFPTSPTMRLITAVLGVIATFVGNAFFSQTLSAAVNKSAGIGPGSVKPGNQNNDSAQTFFRLIATLLFCGPKAISFGMSMAEKAKRMKKMDFDGCAAVLVLLLSRDSRVPYSEIKARIPKLDTLAVFAQMEDIDGVLFLDSDPPGLSLSEALRRELSLFKN